jgi:hypothetical protein
VRKGEEGESEEEAREKDRQEEAREEERELFSFSFFCAHRTNDSRRREGDERLAIV